MQRRSWKIRLESCAIFAILWGLCEYTVTSTNMTSVDDGFGSASGSGSGSASGPGLECESGSGFDSDGNLICPTSQPSISTLQTFTLSSSPTTSFPTTQPLSSIPSHTGSLSLFLTSSSPTALPTAPSQTQTSSFTSSSFSTLFAPTLSTPSSQLFITELTSSASSTATDSSNTATNRVPSYVVPLIVVLLLLAVILIVVIFLLSFFLLRERSKAKDSEMGPLLNNASDGIVLQEFTLKLMEREIDYKEQFEHIPVIEPIPISELEHYVDTKIYDGDEDEYAKVKEKDERFDQIDAFAACNNTKNRYIDILPFDETRVLLSGIATKPGTDYINANYIAGFNCMKEYIAAQGPMLQTLNDFWRMIWEQNVGIIVMVTNPTERGQLKCEKYWPDTSLSQEYGIITVATLTETVQPSFTVREFSLSISGKSQNKKSYEAMARQCKQFHFTAWPDFGVPNNVNVMLKFVKRIRSEVDPNRGPMVVHCSAGVGRTGTFIAIDVQLQRMAAEKTVNIKEFVMKMRAQRPFMIQNEGQYEFIYTAVLYEYLHGDLDMDKSELKKHFEKLPDAFPDSEDSYLDKEFRGALGLYEPDKEDMSVALSDENKSKNRNQEFVPLNMNRVKVANPSEGDNDYINASLVACVGYRAEYIITQHPLQSDIENFWRMIMEKHVSKIVVIGPVEEKDAYWPTEDNLDFGGLTVRQMLHEKGGENDGEGIVIREVEVDWEEHEDYRLVTIFQLESWPTEEDEVPASISCMMEFMQMVKEYTGKELLAVHSSASVKDEASAVFCTISSLSRVLTEDKDAKVNVMETVKRLCNQRPNCLSSKEQYQFIYQVLVSID